MDFSDRMLCDCDGGGGVRLMDIGCFRGMS